MLFCGQGRGGGGLGGNRFAEAGGSRVDNAGSIGEIHFVSVIVGRVMTGGVHHAAVRIEVPNGKTQFGRRAVAVEKPRFTAVFDDSLGTAFGELAREQASVMGEDEAWAPG